MKYRAFLLFLLLALPLFLSYRASGQQKILIPITVSLGASLYTIDTIGYASGATYCLDTALGEVEISLPPVPIFGARLIDRCGELLRLDLYPLHYNILDTFRIRFERGADSSAVRFSWHSGLSWPLDRLQMQDTFGGVLINWNMLSETSDSVTNPAIDELYIISELGICDVPQFDNGVPRTAALSQNYPNPFNPATTVRFSIPHTVHVTLKVYDMVGRGIATLLDETRSAGSYAVPWDAAGLPSGIYLCRITAGRWSETRKIALIR